MTSLHLAIRLEILLIPLLHCLRVLLRFLNLAAILEAAFLDCVGEFQDS
jgi:hypothetical protein